MAGDVELHNEELFLTLNENAARWAAQFSPAGDARPSLAPDVIWLINLLIHDSYVHGAIGYLGMCAIGKASDHVIMSLASRARDAAQSLLRHFRQPHPERAPSDLEREIDEITTQLRTLLAKAESAQREAALASGAAKAEEMLTSELRVAPQTARAVSAAYRQSIETWLAKVESG